jgi:hypothetical protein
MVTRKPALAKREHRLISTHSSQSLRHNYAGLKQANLADIIAYLRTVPPLQ